MGIRSYIKNTAKNNINLKGWSSWNAIKEHGETVIGFAKEMKPAVADEGGSATFDEAMKKYGLTEKDLVRMMKKNLLVAAFCGVLGLGALIWALYLFAFKGFYLSGFVGLALSGLMFSYAFREHFNYFQIKQRRLKCTVKEWILNFFTSRQK